MILESILVSFVKFIVPPAIELLSDHQKKFSPTLDMSITQGEGICWNPTSTKNKVKLWYIS